jgi:hypothetical protein
MHNTLVVLFVVGGGGGGDIGKHVDTIADATD